jgi:uncharacterized protein (DUF433 family)
MSFGSLKMPDKSENRNKSPKDSSFISQKKDANISGRNQHVVRRDDGWAVRTEGNSRDAVHTGTQREAIEHARQIAKPIGSSIVIHDRDGKIVGREVFKQRDWELERFEEVDIAEQQYSIRYLDEYIDKRYFGERPHIRGRRILVSMVASNAEENQWGVSRLAEEFTLSETQVLAALLYYREHKDEIDQQDIEEKNQFDEMYRLHGEDSGS